MHEDNLRNAEKFFATNMKERNILGHLEEDGMIILN
jgi:hypothetical protein